MVRDLRRRIVIFAAATSLLTCVSGAWNDTCDFYGDGCVKQDHSIPFAYIIGTSTGPEGCKELCAAHASCKSWSYKAANSQCSGVDDLEPDVYHPKPGWVSSARWSCNHTQDNTSSRPWFNGEMGTMMFVTQENCNVTFTNVHDPADVNVAEARIGEVAIGGVVVGNVVFRNNRTQLPTALKWVDGMTEGPHGFEIADCPGKGWEFDVMTTDDRAFWDAKDSVMRFKMVDWGCNLTGQSLDDFYAGHTPSEFFTFKAQNKVDQFGFFPRLYDQSSTIDAPVALLAMHSPEVVDMYDVNPTLWDETNIWAAYAGMKRTLAMPICFDLNDHKPEAPGCRWEHDDQGNHVDQGQCDVNPECTWIAEEHYCSCSTANSCETLGGHWEEGGVCRALAIEMQTSFRIDHWKATERVTLDNGDEVSGVHERCEDPHFSMTVDGVARGCCHKKMSICHRSGPGGDKCVNVPGEKRMRLAARGYKITKCNSKRGERNATTAATGATTGAFTPSPLASTASTTTVSSSSTPFL